MTPFKVPLQWLLEKEDPSVRYLALKDLVDLSEEDAEMEQARKEAHTRGYIAQILDKMQPEGYWVKVGPGYSPKYTGGVWSLIALAQLGARAACDDRIKTACVYYLDHAFATGGFISYNGTPSGTIDCLQGNMCAALTDLGYEDSRLDEAYAWMARSVTGEGVQRYYAYKCGPGLVCGANGKLPCSWGAVKVMLAFGKLPSAKHTPLVEAAIKAGAAFLFSCDPVEANYPTREGTPPSRDWWKFGFPVFYITDILQLAEALALCGYGHDPRLQNAIARILSKRDAEGKWHLEYSYTGKTWIEVGAKRQPNKLVTYRALKVLQAVGAWP